MRIALTPSPAGRGSQPARFRRRLSWTVLGVLGLFSVLAFSSTSTPATGRFDGHVAVSASQALVSQASLAAGRQALSKAAAQESPSTVLGLPAAAAAALFMVLLAARRTVQSCAEQACVRATPGRGPPVRS